ncbi:MAG: sigma-70 family RNA polymerase sigma factor [Oscillospiraceae bacterium]|nr:sigma-70 family RNA polymerase sigma factor [Oscillospiraceae bacterium]
MNGDSELLSLARSGDKEAAEQMVIENAGLIWSVARRFFGRGVDPDDLYQLGCLGFVKAVNNFDASFGTRFSTYAVPKIAGEIRRFLRDDGSIKVSRSMKERALVIKQARGRLEQSFGREPTLSELAAETGIGIDEIAVCESAAVAADSLQRETGDEGFTLEQVLGDQGMEDRLVERVALKEAVEALPERERTAIVLRYYHGLTQEAAARIMGVSQVQVSRLERRAVDKLRGSLE